VWWHVPLPARSSITERYVLHTVIVHFSLFCGFIAYYKYNSVRLRFTGLKAKILSFDNYGKKTLSTFFNKLSNEPTEALAWHFLHINSCDCLWHSTIKLQETKLCVSRQISSEFLEIISRLQVWCNEYRNDTQKRFI